ncbi:hypothetical protein PGN35_017035 [Nodosilinea sp. PGN35]|uniref:hypothetical protein n=1 Tax=Nodosilinea sp. PGN35 TaxID=3020489 RepID=UPI0023B26ACB|nr:hypothetical protein [Nodosilinea sp. TSF1-S3]MDF0369545.1 hypothetical protein [Nodosilinea sp. TSF1-S3]
MAWLTYQFALQKIQLAVGDSLKVTPYTKFVQTVIQMDRTSKFHGSMLKGMNIQGETGGRTLEVMMNLLG